MRNDLLSYVMEQAVEIMLRNKRTRPAEQGDKKDILRLMATTARELEK